MHTHNIVMCTHKDVMCHMCHVHTTVHHTHAHIPCTVHSSWWGTELSVPRSSGNRKGILQRDQAKAILQSTQHYKIQTENYPTPLPVCIIYSGRPTMWLSYPVSHTKLARWMTFIGRDSTFLGSLRIFMSAWDHSRKIKGQQLFRNLESVITTMYYVIHIVAMQWSKMNLQRGSASITSRTQMLKVFVPYSISRQTW